MTHKGKRIFFSILLVQLSFILPKAVLASMNYTTLENIPGFESSQNLPAYIEAIYKFGIWTIGISAMLMIVIGGIMYITSAGNTSSTGKAKGIITDALIGIVMALCAWLILYVINPDLVKIKLPNSSMGVGSGGATQNTGNGTNSANGQGTGTGNNQNGNNDPNRAGTCCMYYYQENGQETVRFLDGYTNDQCNMYNSASNNGAAARFLNMNCNAAQSDCGQDPNCSSLTGK